MGTSRHSRSRRSQKSLHHNLWRGRLAWLRGWGRSSIGHRYAGASAGTVAQESPGRKEQKEPMESASLLTQADWQRALMNQQARAAEFFGRSEAEQKRLGYFHTLQEICQQPWTWLQTADRMIAARDSLRKDVAGIRSLALTGSGSSEYAAECVCF